MADFDTQVRESQAQVAEAQAKIAELTSRIETARTKMKDGTDVTFDIENATLEDVHAHTDVMNANIAELIMGLDDVTAAFSKDFDEMRSKTGWESFVGIFSSGKSESMRQERMKTASIDDKLQDLIGKSDVIVQLLEGQLAMLEEQKVKGAIKTDFILSAEIMTIALAAIEAPNVWMQAATLAVVGIGVTVAVYGSVALIVKMDDVGLYLTNNALTPVGRGIGRGLVKFMPVLMWILSVVGTAAMLWVGGSIIIHGLEELGFGWLGHHIHDWAYAVGHAVPAAWEGFAEWVAKATMDGVFGLAYGLLLIPLATKVVGPVIAAVSGKKAAH